MSADSPDENKQPIFGRVDRSEFVGRANELHRIIEHSQRPGAGGLFLLLAPTAGVSELLRQAFDELFNQRGSVIPIYFTLPREGKTPVSVAIEFLNAFLVQYIAFRRGEPSLCQSYLTLSDLVRLAPPKDYEWIDQLVQTYDSKRFSNNDAELIRLCLSVAQRIPSEWQPFVMIDAVAAPTELIVEMTRAFSHGRQPYLLAGLRRQLLKTACSIIRDFENNQILRLEALSPEAGRALLEHVARRQGVALSEHARDLLVQQFECSPLFVTSFIQSARECGVSLTSYLACEQLYVNELMGGRLSRYFAALLEDIAPDPEVRKALLRTVYEFGPGYSSIESWPRLSGIEKTTLDGMLKALHTQEFISRDDSMIQTGVGSLVWKDYLQVRYRLEIKQEPRVLIAADMITVALKRAPQTMARYYRRVAALSLRETLAVFDGQRVPSILLDYARFAAKYKGLSIEDVASSLESETDLLRLPQVVHVATCTSFMPDAESVCDEERCVIAHGFSQGKYTDENQVVWLAVSIDSKLEASLALTRSWFDWLRTIARERNFKSTRMWLIATEGFSPDASEFLAEAGAYGSSRQQFDLLTTHFEDSDRLTKPLSSVNEFEMVVPMGGDNELIVAHTAEEIARRLNFNSEAVNQIKHAVVEAFINASEHSLSPERRIYQRFRVESDKLVITISSRGILPGTIEAEKGEVNAFPEASGNRRGLGLSLIRTLMDEVEFERVDDGTSLRMTKYLHT